MDDAPSAALGHEVAYGSARDDEGAGEVDVEHAPPVLEGELERGPPHDRGGVADADVEPAERGHGVRDRLLGGVGVTEIGGEGHSGARSALDRRDARPELLQLAPDCQPDAARGARDESALARVPAVS